MDELFQDCRSVLHAMKFKLDRLIFSGFLQMNGREEVRKHLAVLEEYFYYLRIQHYHKLLL